MYEHFGVDVADAKMVVEPALQSPTRNALNEDAMDAAIMKRVLEDPDQELVPFALVKRIANALDVTIDDLI